VVSTRLGVGGVDTDDHVSEALQSLSDVFAELGIGQGTLAVERDGGVAKLWVKHRESVDVDVEAVNVALSRAGSFRVVS